MSKLVTKNNVDLEKIIQCPVCNKGTCKYINDKIKCLNCEAIFNFKGDVPILLDPDFSSEIYKNVLSKHSWESYDIEKIEDHVTPHSTSKTTIWQRLSPKHRVQIGPTYNDFIENYSIKELILELGGGPNSLNRKGVVNLDVNNYATVDVIGDARRIPFLNNTFDAIICNSVLENIWEVDMVVSESYRIIKNGGFVFFCVPLICARHHTFDYHRWTLPGLVKLFERFEIMDKGTILGPGMYVNHIVKTIIFSCFSHNIFSNLISLIAAWVLFPIRFLDYIGKRSKDLESCSHTIYIIAQKH